MVCNSFSINCPTSCLESPHRHFQILGQYFPILAPVSLPYSKEKKHVFLLQLLKSCFTCFIWKQTTCILKRTNTAQCEKKPWGLHRHIFLHICFQTHKQDLLYKMLQDSIFSSLCNQPCCNMVFKESLKRQPISNILSASL